MLASALLLTLTASPADFQIDASTRVRINADASPTVKLAARELADTLSQILGKPIKVIDAAGRYGTGDILVGPSPTDGAEKLGKLGLEPEEFVWRRAPFGYVHLYGGGARGTLYAVERFLYEKCGVRRWTPWASAIPRRDKIVVANLDKREKPALEYREPFWFHAFDGEWAMRNCVNGANMRLTEEQGGKLTYCKGFVHTFYGLIPPEKYFASHPEWFSLVDGKRTTQNAQLCTTNPELREQIVKEVEAWISENPQANIVSVSQNDCFNPCQCPNCKAIDDAEGSHAGTMIALANYVAERIEKSHPNVAVDTLAYQYTRKAPKTIRPRKNVIVRLCSIECNFSVPIDHESNQAFAQDVRDWSKLTDRLYIWNYVTNFAHYVQPQPNWFTLGATTRFFAEHGVKGIFDEGAYNSCGGEMAELRAWVAAQLFWDPKADDRKLIDEFLGGYYGAAAAPIRQYMQMLSAEAAKTTMGCYAPPTSAYLSYELMDRAERLWQEAERRVAGDRELLRRVRVGHLPVRYVYLQRWIEFRRAAERAKAAWPLPASRRAAAEAFREVALGPGPTGWSPVTAINEGGLTTDAFVARFAEDPVPPPPLPPRMNHPAPPADVTVSEGSTVYDAQDGDAILAREGDWAELRADPSASDGIACRMPGTHYEWAFQLHLSKLPARLQQGKWHVYVVARVERAGGAPETTAFTCGVYDGRGGRELANRHVSLGASGSTYRSYDLGPMELPKDSYIWVAPTGAAEVNAVWIDRVYFVRATTGR